MSAARRDNGFTTGIAALTFNAETARKKEFIS
jgi:hypothetical protein